MASGKYIALKRYVEVAGHDMSDLFSDFGFTSDNEKVDVSGFNPTGSDEFLAGKNTQSITGTVFDSYASGETWDILWYLHKSRSIFTVKSRPDVNSGVSATNPSLEGQAQLLAWNGGETRGDVAKFTIEFSPADATGFNYVQS